MYVHNLNITVKYFWVYEKIKILLLVQYYVSLKNNTTINKPFGPRRSPQQNEIKHKALESP